MGRHQQWSCAGRRELNNTVVAQLRVGTPTGLVTHLNGKHVLHILVGNPIQTVVEGIRIILGGIGVGVRPQVALIANQAKARVLDTILEPRGYLSL